MNPIEDLLTKILLELQVQTKLMEQMQEPDDLPTDLTLDDEPSISVNLDTL